MLKGDYFMDKTLLRKAAMQSVALVIAVITLSYAMKHYQSINIEASNQTNELTNENQGVNDTSSGQEQLGQTPVTENMVKQPNFDIPITNVTDLTNWLDRNIVKKLSKDFIVIKKPEGNQLSFQLNDLYVNHSIELELTGMVNADFTSDQIFRVRQNELFVGEPIYTELTAIEVDKETGESKEIITRDYGRDISHGITITTEKNEYLKQYNTKVLMELDTVYAYIKYEDAYFYYIDLKKPTEVYDKIIVVDPGHGGKDVGAISRNESHYEKNINLDIVLQLEKLLEKENIKVYYTRKEDETVFLRPRVTLANAVDSDYFISIHCNSNTLASPHGTEVLYYDNEHKGIKTEVLAKIFSEELASVIPLRNRGTVQKKLEDIFIMDKAMVPTILIEVGYLSNANDLNYLSSESNRLTVAQGIYKGILRAYEELPVIK